MPGDVDVDVDVDVVGYAVLVKKMRQLQIEFFKTRSKYTLEECKKIEGLVDHKTASILAPKTPLFDYPG